MTSPQTIPLSDSVAATEVICMNRSRLIATMFYLYGWLTLTVLGVLAVGALVAGIVIDVRWAIVFLMVVFIVTPLLMSFLYFFHGLRPTTAANVVPHILLFGNDEFTIRILEKEKEDNSDGDSNTKEECNPKEKNWSKKNSRGDEETSNEEQDPKSDIEYVTRYEFSLPYSDIERYQSGRDGFIISIKKPQQGFIWLPYTAFGKREEMETALKHIQTSLAAENRLHRKV